jgi:hypothetical protein
MKTALFATAATGLIGVCPAIVFSQAKVESIVVASKAELLGKGATSKSGLHVLASAPKGAAKRYHITPGADTSIATMMTAADAAQTGARKI